MTEVFCNMLDCRNNHNGKCILRIVELDRRVCRNYAEVMKLGKKKYAIVWTPTGYIIQEVEVFDTLEEADRAAQEKLRGENK